MHNSNIHQLFNYLVGTSADPGTHERPGKDCNLPFNCVKSSRPTWKEQLMQVRAWTQDFKI